jgi:predicted TIM-barrel fold metal-dependent hydrolase
VIDADSHVTEPPDVWTSRVPRKYADRVPRLGRDAGGRDVWTLNGEPLARVGPTAVVGWPEPFPEGPPTLADCPPAAYDAKARLELLDDQGIWAQAIYPNVAGFGNQRFLLLDDAELKLACVRAYNDFLRDWASVDPRRFITIMATPFWDVDAAAAEIERGVEAGHKGVLFTGEPQRFGLPFLGDPHWDPLWSAAQDAGVAVHFHIGSGEVSSQMTPKRMAIHGRATTYSFRSVELFLGNGIQLADLMTAGVLERFPDLRFVSVESGVGWVPFVLQAADYSFMEARPGHEGTWDGVLPSERFRRQVYTTYWFETLTPALLEQVPADRILFETDYPHPTCLHGDIPKQIDEKFAMVTDDVRRRIVWDNAAELYGIAPPDQH